MDQSFLDHVPDHEPRALIGEESNTLSRVRNRVAMSYLKGCYSLPYDGMLVAGRWGWVRDMMACLNILPGSC